MEYGVRHSSNQDKPDGFLPDYFMKVLQRLKKRASLIQNNRIVAYALFSKAGFSDELVKDSSILLYTYKDILSI